ncbi:putative T7SS-secreted protein [Streptomyces sp. NPDC057743]|uniref:putative T7SS-secreted protein n=1 Tax=Streptomyces sp. NPDC057743 TaxID=3346236 RepID=UPI00369E3DB6
MAAELGETTDPKQLIPGDAGTLEEVAGALRKHSGKFEDVGNRLGAVRIPGWSGKASNEFWDSFSGEKKQWLYASDAMSDAAAAVSKYATALTTAQQQAAEAIELWAAGAEAPAQTTLQNARQYLREEGEAAGKKLEELAGGGSNAPDWLVKAGKTAEQQKESGKSTREWKKWHESDPLGDPQRDQRRNKHRTFGQRPDERSGGKSWEAKLWERKGDAKVWGAEASGETQVGDGKASGKVGLDLLGAEGSIGGSVKDGNLEAKLSGSAYLAKASAEGSYENGAFTAKAEGSAFAGAEASTTASVGKSGAHLGAEAFAGAKATGSAHADLGGIGAGVNGEAWAGVGAQAKVDAGMKDGKFVIGGSVGVGLGIGGKVGGQIEIDPGKVVDTASDVADALGDGIEAVGDGLESLNPFG